MPTLQNVEIDQITTVLSEAQRRHVPATVTIRPDKRWLNLHSRIAELRDRHVWLTMPTSEDGTPHEFTTAQKVGLSFKLKHHKYLCSVTVAGIEQVSLSEGDTTPVLSVCHPARMQRLQRRAFQRADVPANRIVRASFWLGGREAEPSGTSPDRPVWFGSVTNLSAGGLQINTSGEAVEALETGYIVGLRLAFGTGRDENVYTDAQFRYAEASQDGMLAGFQFVGMGQTPEGHRALQVISAKVAEFQRASEQSRSRR